MPLVDIALRMAGPVTLPAASRAALGELVRQDDPDVLALVLTGSTARGMANEHSDVDVFVVVTDEAAERRSTRKTPEMDEIVQTMADLESVGALGTDDWWARWSFAWVQVLKDVTGGRLEAALRAQATLGDLEQDDVLVDQLDGYVNFAFRAMKAERDGRDLERRLDAAESVPVAAGHRVRARRPGSALQQVPRLELRTIRWPFRSGPPACSCRSSRRCWTATRTRSARGS